jgi:hypothetical protein
MESKQVYPIGWLKIIYQGSFFLNGKKQPCATLIVLQTPWGNHLKYRMLDNTNERKSEHLKPSNLGTTSTHCYMIGRMVRHLALIFQLVPGVHLSLE